MELREYITPLKKWWWLLAVSTIIATVTAYFATRKLPSIYQASTTLSVGRTIYEANPSGNDLGLTRQLAETYADILQQEPIRNATRTKLGLTRLPAYVARPNGSFLEIVVTDTDPERAQVVANELALQLIDLRMGPQQTDQARQAFVNQQLDDLQNDITATQQEIDKLQGDLGKMFSASELANTQKQIDALQIKLTTLQTNYVSLLSNTQQGAINSLSVLSPAARPQTPIGPNRLALNLLAGASGLVLAVGAAYLLEFLDATIKTPEEISRLFGLSVIGYIADTRLVEGKPHVAEQPHSTVAEAFRSLMTNLEFAGVEKPLKTILVTSAAASEGKTTIATNLAITMAQGGKKVILLDADLRRPKVHAFLGLPNKAGVNEIYEGGLEVMEALQTWKDENLAVITAGSRAANPTELLGSEKMSQILSSLEGVAEVVILDGPPFLVADAWVLAAKVDGVLLVVRPTYTHRDAVRTVMEQVTRMGARVVGVALNRIPARQAEYYGGYWYISPYHANNRYGYVGDNGSDKARTGSRRGKMLRGLLGGRPKPLESVAPADGPSTRPALPMASQLETVSVSEISLSPVPDRDRTALELLYAISRELTTQFDLRDLLQRVLRLTLEAVDASSGSIMVLDEKGEVIEGVVAYAGKVRLQDAQNLTDTVERGLAGWVINRRQAALIPSTRDDPRWLSRSWDESDSTSRSAISVPLVSHDRVMGVLTLVHPQPGRFTEDDLSLLTAIGAYVSFNGVRMLEASSN